MMLITVMCIINIHTHVDLQHDSIYIIPLSQISLQKKGRDPPWISFPYIKNVGVSGIQVA